MLRSALLAFVVIVLSVGTAHHTHGSPNPELHNQEHDLSLLAAWGGGAPLPDTTPTVSAGTVISPLAGPRTVILRWAPLQDADSRGPPTS